MKYQMSSTLLAMALTGSSAFVNPSTFGVNQRTISSPTTLSMVLEKPKKEKKLSKLEILKTKSDHLTNPLKEVSANIGVIEEQVCFFHYLSLLATIRMA